MPAAVQRQPAHAILRARNLSHRRAAEMIGVAHSHLGNALTGVTPPSEEVRERLPQLLGVPLTDLFTSESLARFYAGPRGRNGGARKSTGGATRD